jgi:butyryl-CoA dehydrogenase
MEATIARALEQPEVAEHARALRQALQELRAATRAAWSTGDAAEALANAVPYMQAFGHTVVAWIWLDVALAALASPPGPAQQGRLYAARYFHRYELPKIGAWLQVAASRDPTCAEMPQDAF